MKCQMTVLEKKYHGQYRKVVDLVGVPQVGHHLAVENKKGRVVFIVKYVVWEEGKLPRVFADSMGVSTTSFGSEMLEVDGWTKVVE